MKTKTTPSNAVTTCRQDDNDKCRRAFFAVRLHRMVPLMLLVLTSFAAPLGVHAAASFGAATNFAIGDRPYRAAIGDVNGDGKPDLAVANFYSHDVSLLLGGGGSFGAAISVPVGAYPVGVAIGDVNGDGKPDLAATNYYYHQIVVLPGNGDGTFGAATSYPVGIYPNFVAISDLNGDGKPDLAVTGFYSDVSVLLGSGGGSFNAATHFGAGANPFFVVIRDVNGDGRPDLAVSNGGSNDVSVLLGTGTGSFGAATNFGIGTNPGAVAVGDVNGDGKPDLAVANQGGSDVSVLLGTGTGSFGATTNFGVGTNPAGVAIADVNQDGKPDLVTGNYASNDVSVLLGNGTGSFGAASQFTAGTNPISMLIEDMNSDGRPDLAVINYGSNNVSVLLNTSPPVTSLPFHPAADFGVGTAPYGAAVADLNLDGKPDLVTANSGSNNVSVLLGAGSGSFDAATNFAVGTNPWFVAIGDLNGDGKPDLAVTNYIGNNISVLLGTGTGSFGVPVDFLAGTNPFSMTIADVNRDGKPDLAVANGGSGDVSVLLGTGTGSFGAATSFAVGATGALAVTSKDLNGDGKPDLVTANDADNVSVLLGNGDGTFGAFTHFSVGADPYSVAIGDINQDGKPDLVTANSDSDTLSVLLGTGTGSFGAATHFAAGSDTFSVVIADLNGDGKPDLAAANRGSDNVSVLLGTGTGSFGAATNFSAGTQALWIMTEDFNADGKPDLAVSNNSSNNVSVLLGGAPTPIRSLAGDVVSGGAAPDATGGGDGTVFDLLTRGGYLAENGMLAFPGELTGPGVDGTNFKAFWKDDGTLLKRLVRTGEAAPETGSPGAVFSDLPLVPGINDDGQITLLAALGTTLLSSPPTTGDNDTGLWSELGGTGFQILMREDDQIPGLPAGTKVGRFENGCFATAKISATEGEAAFTITMRGASTDTALLRASVVGPTVTAIGVVARENTPAGATGETFGFLNSDYTDAARIDAQGNIVFGAFLKPSFRTSLWYQPRVGALVTALVAGDPAPGTMGATFRSLDVPSMGSGGTFAFRGVLNLDGDNADNSKNDGIWRGSVASGFTNILRRGTTGITGLPPGAKAGNIWSGWLTNANRGAWLGWVDLGGDGISPYPADTFGIYTDLSGAMALLISSGDPAPGIAGATLYFIDHPVVGGLEQLAFIGTVTGGGSSAGVNDKGVWRTAPNGGAQALILRTGSTMDTSQGTKTIADLDLPGSNLAEHQWETLVMDGTGRMILFVTFTDGSTAQVLAP